MMLHNSLPLFETRATGEGVIEGYGATFDGIDSYGDSIKAGAFAQSIQRAAPLMLWQHSRAKVCRGPSATKSRPFANSAPSIKFP